MVDFEELYHCIYFGLDNHFQYLGKVRFYHKIEDLVEGKYLYFLNVMLEEHNEFVMNENDFFFIKFLNILNKILKLKSEKCLIRSK